MLSTRRLLDSERIRGTEGKGRERGTLLGNGTLGARGRGWEEKHGEGREEEGREDTMGIDVCCESL